MRRVIAVVWVVCSLSLAMYWLDRWSSMEGSVPLLLPLIFFGLIVLIFGGSVLIGKMAASVAAPIIANAGTSATVKYGRVATTYSLRPGLALMVETATRAHTLALASKCELTGSITLDRPSVRAGRSNSAFLRFEAA